MKILAVIIWALGVIVVCIFWYFHWFKWGLSDWSTKKKVVESILLFVGSGLIIIGIGIQLFLVACGNYFD